MKISRKVHFLVAVASLAVLALGASGGAQARDQVHDNVYWSVGVSSPGVQLGVSNARPVVVQAPMYPVYQPPAPVYVPPAVYVQPAPVYVNQPHYVQAGWSYPAPHHGWRHRHGHRGQGHWNRDRFDHDRYDGERGGHGGQDRHRQ